MSAESVWPVRCAHCGTLFYKRASDVTRAEKRQLNVYCNRECSGLGRRLAIQLTDAEKKSAKAEYDRIYRECNRELLKAKKSEYFKRTYNPDKARTARKQTMPRHIEYCRRPEYREYKSRYDKEYLARKQFGPFAEAALLLRDLEQEVLSRASRYQIDLDAGRLNKCKRRKQEYGKAVGC